MIAVIGAGFSGLATAFHLLKLGHKVTLFDKHAIGTNTSSAAAGLIHPFPGFAMKVSKFEKEGLQATRQLVGEAQKFSQTPLIREEGIYRVAMNEAQQKRMEELVMERDDVVWCEAPHVKEGMRVCKITSGFAIDCKAYVEALFQLSTSLGMEFIQQEVKELDQFSQVVVACGYESGAMVALDNVEKIKGQVVMVQSKHDIPCTIGKGYIAKGREGLHIGSTYERQFESVEPDEAGKEWILANAKKYIRLGEFDVVTMGSGVRLSVKGDYLPIVKKVKNGLWTICGMGSRGLLYHAYFGKKLATSIAAQLN